MAGCYWVLGVHLWVLRVLGVLPGTVGYFRI